MYEITFLFSLQILKMFLMLAIGFLAVKVKLIPETAGKGLTQVTVGILRPCAILYAFQVEFSKERLLGLLLAIFGAALSHVILIVFAWLLGKGATWLSPIDRASIIYTNSGNLLFPLVAAVMGQEWMFYVCAYMGTLQLFVWTHGQSLICGETKINWKKAVCNLNIIAMGIGLLLFCTQISFPGAVGQAVKGLGDALGSASMLGIGISFANIRRLESGKILRVLSVIAIRLVICPLLVLCVLLALRLNTLLPDAKHIVLLTLLGAGAPTGVVVSQIAQLYDREADHASLIAVTTMLCSIATLPALIWLYETIT